MKENFMINVQVTRERERKSSHKSQICGKRNQFVVLHFVCFEYVVVGCCCFVVLFLFHFICNGFALGGLHLVAFMICLKHAYCSHASTGTVTAAAADIVTVVATTQHHLHTHMCSFAPLKFSVLLFFPFQFCLFIFADASDAAAVVIFKKFSFGLCVRFAHARLNLGVFSTLA